MAVPTPPRCWWRSTRCGSSVCRGGICTHWPLSWAATCRSRCTVALRSAPVAASSWQRCWPATRSTGCWPSPRAACRRRRCSPRSTDCARTPTAASRRPGSRSPNPCSRRWPPGDAAQLAPLLGNDLQPAALSLDPADCAARCARASTRARWPGIVSGSGPTCAFLCSSASSAIDVGVELAGAGVCRTVRAASGPVHGARVVPRLGAHLKCDPRLNSRIGLVVT